MKAAVLSLILMLGLFNPVNGQMELKQDRIGIIQYDNGVGG